MQKESPEIAAMAVIDGKRPRSIDMKMEYGNLHHLCDEVYCNAIAGLNGIRKSSSKTALKVASEAVHRFLRLRLAGLSHLQRADLATAVEQVLAIYPIYLNHYKHHDIQWIARESVFRVEVPIPYPFEPNVPARTVILTGKRDGLYKAKDGNVRGVGLWEVKTKSKIDRAHLADQLRCDSQSLFYLYATMMEAKASNSKLLPVQETYDVLKRPAFIKGKSESVEAYVKRCADRVYEKPNEFFAREVISLRESELHAYANQFLFPEVRSFLEWWDSIAADPSPDGRVKSRLHYLGLGALINAWGKSRYYEALVGNQSSRTLRSIAVPFPELFDDEERAKIEAADDLTFAQSSSQKKDPANKIAQKKTLKSALTRIKKKSLKKS